MQGASSNERRGAGLAICTLAGEDALDQFFCRHPDAFLRAGASRGRLPRAPREPGDPTATPCPTLRRPRGAALARRQRVPWAMPAGPRRGAAQRLRRCAGGPRAPRPAGRDGTYQPRQHRARTRHLRAAQIGFLPGGGGLAALGLARELCDRRRLIRGDARLLPGRTSIYRSSEAISADLRGDLRGGAAPPLRPRHSSRPSTAPGTQPKRQTDRSAARPAHRSHTLGVQL